MNKYKIWLVRGNEKININYRSKMSPALLHYHLRTKEPRIEVGNGVYNVNAFDKFWVQEVKGF